MYLYYIYRRPFVQVFDILQFAAERILSLCYICLYVIMIYTLSSTNVVVVSL